MPTFLLGGINLQKGIVGVGVAKAFVYTVAEIGLKTAPVFLVVRAASGSAQSDRFETSGASEYEAPKAPVRRTTLMQ